jgi:hypothetical protein
MQSERLFAILTNSWPVLLAFAIAAAIVAGMLMLDWRTP